MKRKSVVGILIIVFAVLIAALLIGGSIYLITAKNRVKAIKITPDFTETELGVGSEYTFSIDTVPAKASIKKIECVADDANASFKINKDGKAVLTTGATEGTITVYLEYKGDVKSNVLTFQVIDMIARAQAEAEAQAQAAAEAAAAEEQEQVADALGIDLNAKQYVKMTGSDVNVRSQPNTDCEKLGKAQKGDIFEKVENVDDWTHIIYNGQDGYIKSEFLAECSEEEAMSGASDSESTQATDTTNTTTDNTETKKPEEKKEETQQNTDEQADAAKKAAEEAAKKAAEELQAQQELAAQQAEAAAQAAAAATATAGLTPITCKDGTCYVTKAQLDKIHATWDFAGDAVEMAGHHNIGELEQIIGPTQH